MLALSICTCTLRSTFRIWYATIYEYSTIVTICVNIGQRDITTIVSVKWKPKQ